MNTILPGYFPSGMTVIEEGENEGKAEQEEGFRNKWGIPFGRPGNAVDYAQVVISTATVSLEFDA